ncbi:LysM peptidoglycan-binding domain-containing protein [uncultured Porphyromonas sp.]|nr:LysM peptidoglycan-binding domain-containing protein [uncultured Porphyromonas sp.]
MRRGDTLSKIAKRHGVSASAIKRANGLKGRNPKLRPGQRLKIPK